MHEAKIMSTLATALTVPAPNAPPPSSPDPVAPQPASTALAQHATTPSPTTTSASSTAQTPTIPKTSPVTTKTNPTSQEGYSKDMALVLSLLAGILGAMLALLGFSSVSYVFLIALLCVAAFALVGARSQMAVMRVALAGAVLLVSMVALSSLGWRRRDAAAIDEGLAFAFAAVLALTLIAPLWSRSSPIAWVPLLGASVCALAYVASNPSRSAVLCVVLAAAIALSFIGVLSTSSSFSMPMLISTVCTVVTVSTTYANTDRKADSIGWTGFAAAIACVLMGTVMQRSSRLRVATISFVVALICFTIVHRKVAEGKDGYKVGAALGGIVLTIGLIIALRSATASMNAYSYEGQSVQQGLGGRVSLINSIFLLALAASSAYSLGGKPSRTVQTRPDPSSGVQAALPISLLGTFGRSFSVRTSDIPERVYRLAPALAAIGIAAASDDSMAAWTVAACVAASSFLHDRLSVRPPPPPSLAAPVALRSSPTDSCDEKCAGKGVLCLAACRNKCAKSYCARMPNGIDFPTHDKEGLLGMCTTHAFEYNRALGLAEHRRSAAQQQCVQMHAFDTCIDTMCAQLEESLRKPKTTFSRSDAEDLRKNLSNVNDVAIKETDTEFLARISSSRLQE